MGENRKHVLFLCSERSVRELMAASLLAAQDAEAWNIWIAPGAFASEDIALAHQVLDEVHTPLLIAPQTAEPAFDRSWDEGVILCSGAADS